MWRRHNLTLTDRWILLYLWIITLLVLVRWQVAPYPGLNVFTNVFTMIAIGMLVKYHRENPESPFLTAVHQFYPIPLLIWWYPQVCSLRHLFFMTDLDPLVLKAELALFHQQWYIILPQRLPAGVLDLFHGVYFVYYISLFLFAALAFRKQRQRVGEYIFVLMGVTLSLQLFVMIFPSSGPVYHRAETITHPLLLTKIMNWIYQTFDRGGGAFPSIHAAASVVMTWYGSRFFPRWKPFFVVLLCAILTATVACSYHYVLDMVTGAILGAVMIRPLKSVHSKYQNED